MHVCTGTWDVVVYLLYGYSYLMDLKYFAKYCTGCL